MGGAAWISEMHRPGGLGWDAEMLFYLIKSAFIHCLSLTFNRENLPLLHHLRGKADDLDCRVKTLHIDGDEEIDYALVNFLGVHLKPQTYKTLILFELREDYVMLYAHNAMRPHVKHFECDLIQTPAPDCLLPELFGVDVLKTCAIITPGDPRPWIGKFVERFEKAERGANVVRSVTLLHQGFHQPPLSRHIVHPLVRPRRTDAPTPHSEFVKKWLAEAEKHILLDGTTTTQSTVAELFLFENAKSAKRLNVFVWPIEQVDAGGSISFHYAYLLQVVDM